MKNHKPTTWILTAAILACLTGCSSWMGEDEAPPLPGDRLSVIELQKKLEPDPALVADPYQAPTPWTNSDWPQTGGEPGHAMQHLSYAPEGGSKIWSVDIGAGSTRTNPLTAEPVVADGKILTLDTDGNLSAFSADRGKKLWQVFAGARDEDDTAIGGGLAVADHVVFVTNGYAEILAIHTDQGHEVWRAPLPAPARAAPSVLDGRVYIVTMDNRLMALDAASGTQIWTYRGVAEGAALLGAAAPAITHDLVVAPFSSGDLIAFRTANGSTAWADNLAPVVRLGGATGLNDIRALPVIDNGLVIAISYAGRLVAIDARTGTRVWQRDIAGAETPWVAGPYVFVLSRDHQVMALSRDTGAIRWITDLPGFEDMEERTGPLHWTGPIYAGGRLKVFGSHGHAMDIDPANGQIVREIETGVDPAVPPVVARGVLYLLAHDGTLTAWQ